MEVLSRCPLCDGEIFQPFLAIKDYSITNELFNVVSCARCDFKFTNPRPASNEIGKYYESVSYVSHSDTNKGLINKLYHFVRAKAIKSKIELVNSLGAKNKTILDIGCGTGTFIGEINKKGWTASGVEPNKVAREAAIKNYSVPIFGEEKLSEFSEESFSIITMWHVLEHVHLLRNRIAEIKKLLENGGYAIIAVPNYTSWDAQHYKEQWAAYDVPRHLYHFSPKAIKELFYSNSLKHRLSLPMKFDSFYVSMLSEKYKKSSLGNFKAFLNGWKSNLKARGDAEKFSSVIYIFQK